MRLIHPGRLAARLSVLLCLWLFSSLAVHAQDGTDGLLPVTEAYKLTTDASTPGVLKLHWTIAPDYYLYRGRMKFKAGDGLTLGDAQLPDGKKYHDEYLGDVETYHGGIDATVPYTLAAGTARLKLSVQYQGCHEVDPKICYPPHTEQLDLPLPVAPATADTGNTLGAALGKLSAGNRSAGTDSAALPPEQAFRLEALATDRQHLLLRWTMPKGYYLYRNQTSLHLKNDGLALGEPEWPAGTSYGDPHFGQTTVYFGELPGLPGRRTLLPDDDPLDQRRSDWRTGRQ